MTSKIVVLGAGNGGQAVSGHLAMRGFRPTLYEHPGFAGSIRSLFGKHEIELEGVIQGTAEVNVTTDIKSAVVDADLVMIVTPAFAQRTMLDLALPYVQEGTLIVFMPDNYAVLEFSNLVRKGRKKSITLAGTSSLPYACRLMEPGHIKIAGIKNRVLVSTLPSVGNSDVVKILKRIIPQFEQGKNMLDVDLSNLNMVIHCPTAILNAGRIEHGERFKFYSEGITPSIANVIEQVDRERLRVRESLGLDSMTALEILREQYKLEGDTLYKLLVTARVYNQFGDDSPSSLAHRYFTEDVPYGLVPLVSLAKFLSVPVPNSESLVQLASSLNRSDYQSQGRTIMTMGLNGFDMRKLCAYLDGV